MLIGLNSDSASFAWSHWHYLNIGGEVLPQPIHCVPQAGSYFPKHSVLVEVSQYRKQDPQSSWSWREAGSYGFPRHDQEKDEKSNDAVHHEQDMILVLIIWMCLEACWHISAHVFFCLLLFFKIVNYEGCMYEGRGISTYSKACSCSVVCFACVAVWRNR